MKHRFVYYIVVVLFCCFSCKTGKESNTNNEKRTFLTNTGNPAVDALSQQIQRDSTNADLFYQRSKAYADMDVLDYAITDLRKAVEIDSLNPNYYILLSDLHLENKRSKIAYDVLTLASDRFPESVNVHLKYAELCIILEQNQNALKALQRTLILDEENAQGYFLLGILMKFEGEKQRAKDAFIRVTEIDPELTDAYILLGELFEKDNPKMALQYFNNAVTVDPENINAIHAKAFFLQNNDKVEQALELYRKISIIDKNYPPAYLNAGILLMERKEYEKAYEQFNILTQIEPTNHLAFYYRGTANESLGRKDLAEADYDQALVFKADYQKAIEGKKRLKYKQTK